jgi:NAD(P)-dependent dehydrogenase (short-subunit alcohol dehydrogenase family)
MKAVGSKEEQNWQNHIALVTGANRGIGTKYVSH